MAAAARLLVNPREREDWLASWAVRRLPGDDTGPMGLDSAPAPLDAPPTGPGALATQRSFRISPAQLARIREALAHEVGPIAVAADRDRVGPLESAGESARPPAGPPRRRRTTPPVRGRHAAPSSTPNT